MIAHHRGLSVTVCNRGNVLLAPFRKSNICTRLYSFYCGEALWSYSILEMNEIVFLSIRCYNRMEQKTVYLKYADLCYFEKVRMKVVW